MANKKPNGDTMVKLIIIAASFLIIVALFVAMIIMLVKMAKESSETVSPATTSAETTEYSEEIDFISGVVPIEDVDEEEVEIAMGSIEKVESDIIAEEPLSEAIGNDIIRFGDSVLTRYDLPSKYYQHLNYSYFQPFEDWGMITDTTSGSYRVVHSGNTYVDSNGMIRSAVTNGLKIDGQDDYVIALGTYYKPHNTVGQRYLIVTSTGMYTAIAGDEKADDDTDAYNMFGRHGEHGEYAGVIEWIVDYKSLDKSMKISGTATTGPIEALQGKLEHIYLIERR